MGRLHGPAVLSPGVFRVVTVGSRAGHEVVGLPGLDTS